MNIIPHKKFFLGLALTLVIASVVVIIFVGTTRGLPLGIDFTGGSLLELEFTADRPSNEEIRGLLELTGLAEVIVQPTGQKGIILRLKEIDEPTHQNLLTALKKGGEFEEKRFESIGPVIGQELWQKARVALIIVLLLIVLYITWVFRKVSYPVSSWKYGLSAIAALVHDITIPTGIVVLVGSFGGFQIDAFFITALLTILGFSVHDTIVVFDRIRENLLTHPAESFDQIANRSVNEIMNRSINTSLTLLFVLVAVLFLGGETTRNLVFVLILGSISGTYSSIFVASPLLTLWIKNGKRK